MENEIAQGKTLGDVARGSRVGHDVYSSVGSAHKKTGIPHFESKAEIEDHLKGLGLPLTDRAAGLLHGEHGRGWSTEEHGQRVWP